MTFFNRKNNAGFEPVDEQSVRKANEQAKEGESVKDASIKNPRGILALQRIVGNRALQRFIQPKLMVGPVGDQYEQEADRVAEQVLSGDSHQASPAQREGMEEEDVQASPLAASITPLQRQEDEEELQMKSLQRDEEEEELQMQPIQRQAEEEELQMKPLQRDEEEEELQMQLIQRQAEEEELQMKPLQRDEEEEELQMQPLQRDEEEEELQMKPIQRLEDEEEIQTRRGESSFQAGPEVENRLSASKGQGDPLSGEMQSDMKQRFGSSFRGVRIHTGNEAIQTNRELKSRAFTHGKDIFMGQGQYNPGSTDGKRLIAHELTHVIQQTGIEKDDRKKDGE
jgi:hypothetical protein